MTTNEHPPRVCSSWFTYLPTYLLTNLPANLRVQSPRPVHRSVPFSLCACASPRDIVSLPPSLFHSRRHLSLPPPSRSTYLSFPLLADHLFLPCSVSPLGDRDHAARALPSLCPLRSAARDAALLTDTLGLLSTVHSASSRRCVSCIVSPHRAAPRRAAPLRSAPRHATPRQRLSPFPPRTATARSESRLTNLLESAR